jgi:putative methionine-R-sulfoxide reductase with GAF domain
MNEDERRSIVFTLHFFLGTAILVSGIILILGLTNHQSVGIGQTIDAFTVRSSIVALVTGLLMLWLTRRRNLLIPRLVLPLSAFGLAVYLVGSSLGVHDEAMMLFPLSIALAGLLLGRIGILVYTISGIVATFWLAFAEWRGLLVTPFSSVTNATTVITTPMLLALTALMIFLMVNYLSETLKKSRLSQEDLEKRNVELQALQSSLATLVDERTQHAEKARQDAETARQDAESATRALEIQMWQITGQAQLNEVMRGDQVLAALVENVVGFLCQYLKLPVGVLYVRKGQRLHLIGGYAHPSDLPGAFDLDEGMLGQAVVDRQLVIVSQPTDTHIRVTSALGEMAPTHVIIVPLVYAEQVLGVIELGAFESFADRSVQFLERVSESIAVALHSAQTRLQLSELLDETQRQAEELQAQEEELRAANEELLARAELL